MKKKIFISIILLFAALFTYANSEKSICTYSAEYNGNTVTISSPAVFTSDSQRASIDIVVSGFCFAETFTFTSSYSWIAIASSTSDEVNIQLQENTSSSSRSGSISGTTSSGITLIIYIQQNGGSGCTNGLNYYVDTDGDGLGDYNATPVYSCVPIVGSVTNNSDLCPNDPNPTPDGCPVSTENRNWIQSENFDILNNSLGASKTYYNELGRQVQNQSYDIKTQRMWASHTFYDYLGRPAFSTFNAPITPHSTPQSFLYKPDFIKKTNNTIYSTSDFENGDIYNPPTVKTDINTLGWYYSSSNNDEPYQDTSDRPFSRTIYSQLNPGSELEVIGGNKLNGQWRQGYSFSVPAAQELYYAFGYNHFEDSPDVSEVYPNINTLILNDSNKQIVWHKSNKNIRVDVYGNENVAFVDDKGKVLATAKSGGATQYSVTSLIGKQGYVDIHLPVGCQGTLSFIGGSSSYKVYDLKTDAELTDLSSIPAGFYRIEYTGSIALNESSDLTYIHEFIKAIFPVQTSHVGVTYKVNYHEYSLNYYNSIGQLEKTLQPLGFNAGVLNILNSIVFHDQSLMSQFQYNSLDQLIYSKRPDEGESWFKFRNDGNLRFSQDSKQKLVNEFSYTDYDAKGRSIEGGVASGNFSSLNPNITGFSGTRKNQFYTEYDYLNNPNDLVLLGLQADHQNPSYLSGKVAKTYNKDSSGNLISETYYSYNVFGEVDWIVQNIVGLGVKTIDYEYDSITGEVAQLVYQKNVSSELFIHRYTYNSTKELTKVETSTNGSTYITHADYEYYETGELKRINLAGGIQGMDFVYNLNGGLKSINHPSLLSSKDPGGDTDDLFGLVIDYYTNDYLRNSNFRLAASGFDRYDGSVKAITSNTDAFSDLANMGTYYYGYNNRNYMQWAFHAKTPRNNSTTTPISFSSMSSGDYNVYNISYDVNGNLKTLSRNKNYVFGLGNTMDKLTYNYENGTSNRLDYVDDLVTGSTNADDIKDQSSGNYTYDEIGQLISNTQEGVSYDYNVQGLVENVYKNGSLKVSFQYNDKNYRTRKKSYNNGFLLSTTHYVRDNSGSLIAVYENGTLDELPISGHIRLGMYKKSTDLSYYQLTDHQGTVRAVIQKDLSGNAAALTTAKDYYPFGMGMPNRELIGSEQYKYAYQGQEKDPETQKEAFQLRIWDGRLGRWLTTDPARQYYSPYKGMGNAPMYMIDPDGACAQPDDKCGWLKRAWYYIRDKGYLVDRWDFVNKYKNVEWNSFTTLEEIGIAGASGSYLVDNSDGTIQQVDVKSYFFSNGIIEIAEETTTFTLETLLDRFLPMSRPKKG